MSHLRLVRWNETALLDVVQNAVKRLMESDEILTVSMRTYGSAKLPCYGFTADGSDEESFRVIVDLEGLSRSRMGVHHTIDGDFDVHDLQELIDQALIDNFDTIWIHE